MAAPAQCRCIVHVARAAELQRMDVVDLGRPLPLAADAELATADNGALD